MYVWIEYVCSRCDNVHRLRMDVVPEISHRKSHNIKRKLFEVGHIRIDDVVVNDQKTTKASARHGGSIIYCDPETPIHDIVRVVTQYMFEFYEMKSGTVKVEAQS